MPLSDTIQNVQLTPSISDQFALLDAQRQQNGFSNAGRVISFFRDRGVSSRVAEISPDSVLVLGTATSGRLYTPILPDISNIEATFGAMPVNQTRETSLVKGYYEVFNSIREARIDIRVVRIGNAKKAALILPERSTSAGARFQGGPIDSSDRAVVNVDRRKVSLVLESIEEGDRYNNITVLVENAVAAGIGSGSSLATNELNANRYLITFSGLPDGQAPVTFDNIYVGIDRNIRSNPNYIINSAQLARAVNLHPVLSQYIVASVSFLPKSIDVVITDIDGGFDSTKRPLVSYSDISPMSPNVIDPDVDAYVLVDTTVLGQPNIYFTGTGTPPTVETSGDPNEIIFNLIFRYGVANPLIPNSGNFNDVIAAEDVGSIICIRPFSDEADVAIEQGGGQAIRDVYGYYVVTREGVSATNLGALDAPQVATTPTPSWGDNVATLDNVTFLTIGEFIIPGGTQSFTFTEKPRKTLNDAEPTILTFVRRVVGEVPLVVGPKIPLTAATIDMFLDYAGQPRYADGGFVTSLLERTVNNITQVVTSDVDVFLIRNNADTAITNANDTNKSGLVKGVHYDFDVTTGKLTWKQDYAPVLATDPPAYPLQLGDRVLVSYRYEAAYTEAKLRSGILRGDNGSYFVSGRTVLFGATQANELEVGFRRDNNLSVNEVVLDPSTPEFGISFNRNDLIVGDVVNIGFSYVPELPGPPDEDLDFVPDNIWRMTGGSDGTYGSSLEDKTRYKEELIRAYRLIENWPCRTMLPVGAYLDDIVEGYNFETGLPEPRNAGFHLDLIQALARKSRNVRECTSYMATRPPSNPTPTPIQSFNWVMRHIIPDTQDTTRPANVIQATGGPDSFRLNCIVGTPVGVIAGVGNSILNPAFVYAGMKEDLTIAQNLERSMLHMTVPYDQQVINITSLEDINGFRAFRYCPMIFSIEQQQYVIGDAGTLAIPTSQFTRQYVVDVAIRAVNLCREVAAKYIGRPRRVEELTAMRANMGLALKKLVPINLIDCTLNLADVPNGNITGKTKMLLHLTTAVEIQEVEIETELRLG